MPSVAAAGRLFEVLGDVGVDERGGGAGVAGEFVVSGEQPPRPRVVRRGVCEAPAEAGEQHTVETRRDRVPEGGQQEAQRREPGREQALEAAGFQERDGIAVAEDLVDVAPAGVEHAEGGAPGGEQAFRPAGGRGGAGEAVPAVGQLRGVDVHGSDVVPGAREADTVSPAAAIARTRPRGRARSSTSGSS
ncbi:hypothetical protein [Amycolatopsis sp. ATCC 39116]|uniref:hypothetical protein n=1 Tax=Amycolatopsis sp. (strain ATCC 39116 / 75iv2) TaxID=385957 RepID=UPI00026279B7|nr:hypothetical protein [Amycolatopsis sp. ATCC 39116]